MLSLQNPEQVYNFWTSKKDKDKKKKNPLYSLWLEEVTLLPTTPEIDRKLITLKEAGLLSGLLGSSFHCGRSCCPSVGFWGFFSF